MTYEITEIDTTRAPEELLGELHELYVSHDAEALPNDPAVPLRQRIAEWRHIPEHRLIRRWILREEDQISAAAFTYMNITDDLNNGFVLIYVRPDCRRRGLARALAVPVIKALEEGERGSVITDVWDGAEWEPKLADIGLKKALQDRRSRLVVADLDWELMDRWIERARERASDYELVYLETPIPDQHLQQWCDLMRVMNTAPREDLEFEDFSMTPEKWRDIEEKELARGNQLVGHVAVHTETGDFVGLSEMLIQKHQPDLAWQGDTGVDAGHRNKGLGRWLKAATIKRVAADHPEIERVDTYNAGSNEPMLNINIEMGYKPILVANAWQGDVATVKERLGF